MSGGKTRKVNPKVDPDVVALLSQWSVEHEAARLAKNGVLKMIDLESMMEEDIKEFGYGLDLAEATSAPASKPGAQDHQKQRRKSNAVRRSMLSPPRC